MIGHLFNELIMLFDCLRRLYFTFCVVGEKNSIQITGNNDHLYVMLARLIFVPMICFKGKITQTVHSEKTEKDSKTSENRVS